MQIRQARFMKWKQLKMQLFFLAMPQTQPSYHKADFDVKEDGSKRAQEDFAAFSEKRQATKRMEKTYKYLGNYYQLLELLKK